MKTKRMLKPVIMDRRTIKNIFTILEPNCFTQGSCYKSETEWGKALPTEIIYIPEYSYKTMEPSELYTKQDFINIAKEYKYVEPDYLFDMVDWQHPETLADEIEEVEEDYNENK